jgi:hypothetical protein
MFNDFNNMLERNKSAGINANKSAKNNYDTDFYIENEINPDVATFHAE